MTGGDQIVESGTLHGGLAPVLTRLVLRVRCAIFLSAFLRWSALGMVLTGCAVLLLRALLQIEPSPELCFALAPSVAVGLGCLRLTRNEFDPASAAAWLDVELGGSGAFVTDFERPDARWSSLFEERLRERDAARVLRPSMRLTRPALLTVGALGFLGASLWVEVPKPRSGPSPELVQALVGSLGEKLGLLSETVALDEDLESDLTERLERLQSMTEDLSPESLLASIDALEERIGAEAARFGLDIEGAQEALRQSAMDWMKDPERAVSGVQGALAAARDAGLMKELPEELQGLIQGGEAMLAAGTLDPAQLLQMGLGMAKFLETPLGELVQGGLLDPSKLRQAVQLADLFGLLEPDHVCDETCGKGGT